ncbi:MAG: T9SS type A sorting domain-containing protein, partial [Bacteroidota bacterium]
GTDQDGVLLYTNTGSADAPAFTLAEDVFGLSDLRRVTPALADLDADSDLDLVIGSLTGGLQYFENQTVPANTEVIDSPLPQAAIHNYPNPFAEKTTITFDAPAGEAVRILLFDAIGRLVYTVHEGTGTGSRQVLALDMTDQTSGVYFLQLVVGIEKAPQIVRPIIVQP